jgi:hypothetical protein
MPIVEVHEYTDFAKIDLITQRASNAYIIIYFCEERFQVRLGLEPATYGNTA